MGFCNSSYTAGFGRERFENFCFALLYHLIITLKSMPSGTKAIAKIKIMLKQMYQMNLY